MNDVLVTGASSGIGYEVALNLADKGNRVFALSRNRELLDRLSEEASARKREIIPVVADLASFNFTELESVLNSQGCSHLKTVFHNAGSLINKPFSHLEPEDWMLVYKVNVFGVAMLTRFLLSRLGGERSTHIVMAGSMGGLGGTVKFPGLSAYSSSKGALAILAECLAEEFKGKGIFVNYLAFGAVQTEMLGKAFPGYQAPIGPKEMATFVGDFCESGYKFFNGRLIPVSLSTP
jgi:NAD(P)-dependent dehydrogenase (short-subunit alcohol dehydrogenase family)